MRIALARPAALAVRRGHPWVFREALVRPPRDLASGAVVELADDTGAFVGRGLWDADSPIAVRIHERDPARALDERSILARIDAALRVREALFDGPDTTAYRLCNGEGDRVPALVLDRYNDVVVARIDGDALGTWVERLAAPLAKLLASRGATTLALRRARGEEGATKLRTLVGPPPPDRVVVRERGMAMEVDLSEGQKTGAFLDQRENRARVRDLAKGGRSVLNLFSYAGGFSVAAALGGATRVTSVDIASGAHATAQRTFRANGIDPSKHAFVTADALAFLDDEKRKGRRYDLVIPDPPSFAPNEKARARALAAYRRLHGAAASLVEPGGIFCASSCSSHVHAEDFVATLDDAALGRDDLRLCELFGGPADHPTLPAWSEGRYLKFALLR